MAKPNPEIGESKPEKKLGVVHAHLKKLDINGNVQPGRLSVHAEYQKRVKPVKVDLNGNPSPNGQEFYMYPAPLQAGKPEAVVFHFKIEELKDNEEGIDSNATKDLSHTIEITNIKDWNFITVLFEIINHSHSESSEKAHGESILTSHVSESTVYYGDADEGKKKNVKKA